VNKAPLWVLAGVILALAGVSIWLDRAFREPAAPVAPNTTSATIGFPTVAATAFPDVEGRPQSLGQWQGKLLVVNFWATWCAPCREEMPIFDAIHQKYSAKNVQIVGIAADTASKVTEFQKSTPVRYPLLVGPTDAMELSKRLGNRIGVLPHTVIFSADGKLLLAKLGPFTKVELESIIAENTVK